MFIDQQLNGTSQLYTDANDAQRTYDTNMLLRGFLAGATQTNVLNTAECLQDADDIFKRIDATVDDFSDQTFYHILGAVG